MKFLWVNTKRNLKSDEQIKSIRNKISRNVTIVLITLSQIKYCKTLNSFFLFIRFKLSLLLFCFCENNELTCTRIQQHKFLRILVFPNSVTNDDIL